MKKNKQHDPFKNLILDDYEKELENSLARGEWKSVKNSEELKEMFREAATRYRQLEKSKPITVRVNQGDLIKLQARAKNKNIPYQTLLSALIRAYVEDDYSIKL